mgnify:CR=1 FL=1
MRYTGNTLHPFGMLLVGRSWQSVYRFMFNGYETEDAISRNNSGINFGERMYNAQIGRWIAVDPLFKLQPAQSPYKAFLNNPNLYIDNGGNTEWKFTRYIIESTGESFFKIEVVDPDKLYSEDYEVTNDFSHSKKTRMGYFDIINYETIIIDENGFQDKVDVYEKPDHILRYTKSQFALFRWLGKNFTGDGGKRPGYLGPGIMWMMESGGVDPTRFTNSDVPLAVDIDQVLEIMELLTTTLDQMELASEGFDYEDLMSYIGLVELGEQILQESMEVDIANIDKYVNALQLLPSKEFRAVCQWHFENKEGAEKYVEEDHKNGMVYVPIQWIENAVKENE